MSTKSGRYGDPRRRRAEAVRDEAATTADAIDAARQMVALRKMVNPDGDKPIAACRPVELPPILRSSLPPGDIPDALQDDTIKACEFCGCDCWVGPVKLALAAAGEVVIGCMPCAVRVAGPDAPITDLNPDRVERPRRS